MQELFRETRARVEAFPSRDTPDARSERILTIGGTEGDKDRAVRKLLGMVWKQYGKEDRDGGFFRILIPNSSVPVVIGNRGTTINRISNRSGAEIDIPKDYVMGTKDRAVNIRGSVLAIQEAVREIVSEIQRLVNNKQLTKRDFPYRIKYAAGKDIDRIKDPSARAEQEDVSLKAPAEYDSGQSACMLISRREGDLLTSDEVIETVKQLESQYEVLVNLVEAPSPPFTGEHEMIEISGSRVESKQVVVGELIKILETLSSDSSLIVIPAECFEASLVQAISAQFKHLQAKPEQHGNTVLVSLSGPSQQRSEAAKLLVASIDAAAYRRRGSSRLSGTSLLSEGSDDSAVLELKLDLSESQLQKIKESEISNKHTTCEWHFDKTCLRLYGSQRNIADAVFTVLSIGGFERRITSCAMVE